MIRDKYGRFSSQQNVGLHKAKPANNKLTNHIAFVLDESGSMAWHRNAVIEQFNLQLENLQSEAKKTQQTTTESLYTFDTHRLPQVRLIYYIQPILACPRLTEKDYSPTGGTPLYDGIAAMIDDFQTLPDKDNANTSFLAFVITDGEENSSRKETLISLQLKI